MQYLKNLITETKNKRAKESLLVIQQFINGVEATQDCRTFVTAMLQMCGANKDRYTTYISGISIGRIADEGFENFLNSNISCPIVVPSNYEDEPRLIIKDKYDTIVEFNLVDIQVKKVEISKVRDNLLHYLFYLHSQYVNLDYRIDMTVVDVE